MGNQQCHTYVTRDSENVKHIFLYDRFPRICCESGIVTHEFMLIRAVWR